MAEQIAGVPLTKDFPVEIDDSIRKGIKDQKKEIESLGVNVTGVHILGEGAPPRFFIVFPPGPGSYKFRGMLESKHYDVGQQMGDKMLKFYVSRRTKKGEGWKV